MRTGRLGFTLDRRTVDAQEAVCLMQKLDRCAATGTAVPGGVVARASWPRRLPGALPPDTSDEPSSPNRSVPYRTRISVVTAGISSRPRGAASLQPVPQALGEVTDGGEQ